MVAFLLFLLLQLPDVDAGPKPTITQSFPSEKLPEAAVEQALQRYGTFTAGDWYYYNRVDLNGDDIPEVLVYVEGGQVCGSGGCPLFVMKRNNGGWVVVTEISLAQIPVVVSSRRTNGWEDLILWQASYEWNLQLQMGLPSYYAVLQFDGRQYPENPSGFPAAPLKEPTSGTALMANPHGAEFGVRIRLDCA